MMSANLRNQNMDSNMDSWKSGNRYQAMRELEFPSLSEAKTLDTKKVIIVPLKKTENYKTRMCNSLDKNVHCWHGENCQFAHSLEELVIRDCRFKDWCQSKICFNKHPQESRDEVIIRTGLNKYNTSTPKHKEIDVEVSCDRQTNYNWANSIKASLKLPTQHEPLPPTFKFGGHRSPLLLEPLLEKEIVLRVPKVMAIQALELAMNSGNRCIRVEVIE